MDELTELAVAGATTLVTQMATDAWAQVRDRVAAFLARRRGGEEEAVRGELERSRADLVAARDEGDEEAASDIQAEWRSRLRRTLRSDPEAVAELRALLDELAPPPDTSTGMTINNTVSGGVRQGSAIQVGTVSGGLSIGETRG